MTALKVTFLGTGTSMGVPVIACDCDVCKSAAPEDSRLRSSILIELGGRVVCVDSGPDFRAQMLKHNVRQLDAIVYTHEHKDHTAGMDDVRAYNFILKKNMVLHVSERVEQALRHDYHYAFAENKYPGVPDIEFERIDTEPFYAAGIKFTPLPVMHHKLPVLGFRIGDFAYITDANFIPEQTWGLLQGVEVLVLNALRKTSHISHFTLDEAVKVGQKAGAKKTYFTHISHQMGKHAEVNAELPDGLEIAYDGLVVEIP